MSFQQPGEYYKHSGKFPLYSIFHLFLIGVLGSVLLSIVYGAILAYIPFIIIGIGAWIVMILGVGGLMILIGRWARIRNMMILFVFGLIVGIIATYLSWVFYLAILFIKDGGSLADAILFFVASMISPGTLFESIRWIANNAGISISGGELPAIMIYGYWGIEALGLIFGPAIMAYSALEDQPFDEQTKEWLNKEHLVEPLQPTESGVEGLKAAAEKGDFTPIHDLVKMPAGAAVFWKLKLLYNESQTLFVMALKNVTETVDSNGSKTTNEEYLIKNLIVDKATFADLLTVGKEPPTSGAVEADPNAPEEPASREPGQITPEGAEDDPYRAPE